MSEISELEKAVDEFADAMKARLRSKAKQGWTGWQGMGRELLGGRMLENAARSSVLGCKKSLVDVANLAMMIHRDEMISSPTKKKTSSLNEKGAGRMTNN